MISEDRIETFEVKLPGDKHGSKVLRNPHEEGEEGLVELRVLLNNLHEGVENLLGTFGNLRARVNGFFEEVKWLSPKEAEHTHESSLWVEAQQWL